MLHHIGKLIYPDAIWHFSRKDNAVYLTFDDGPHPILTPWIIELLKAQKIQATFFCLAQHAEKYPEIIQQLIANRHTIGNHGYAHLNGWKTNKNDYLLNFEKGNEALKKIIGDTTNNYLPFRPPYGKLTLAQYYRIKDKTSIVMWDVLSKDYDQQMTPDRILDNVISTKKKGSIIVFHDNEKSKENLKYVLPNCIDLFKENLYTFDKF